MPLDDEARPDEGRPGALRRVELGDGRRLEVRHATPADLDSVVSLYDSLSNDDLHLRFFTAFRPPRAFLERWVDPSDGDVTLVVEVLGGPSTPEIVADAGYCVLSNGNGELAITVAPAWRGWLAPFLLDALVEQAAERGVPNLEAELLAENRPMLALVRPRGMAVLAHPEWSLVRVAIGTAGRTPTWPQRDGRPRVLVEGTERWRAERDAEAAGLDVVTCPGPAGRPGGRCPLLDGGACPLASGADVIVVRTDGAAADALRDRHAASATPVVLEGSGAGTARLRPGEIALAPCAPSAQVIAAVRRALDEGHSR